MALTLAVFGGKSTAMEIAEVVRRFSPEGTRLLLVVPESEDADGTTRVRVADLAGIVDSSPSALGYIISMSNQAVRRDCLEIAARFGMNPTSVIHPNAFISDSARLGEGIYVAANCAVSTAAQIASHVVVNFNVTVGHDSTVGSHTFLNPGARISGHAAIGDRVLIGSNAFVYQGVNVGDDCRVDALTYVDRDLPPNSICTSRESKTFKRVV